MGSSKQTQKSHSVTNTNQKQETTGPGTAWGSALLEKATPLQDEVLGQTAFGGDRVAAPTDLGAGNYVAQWGPTPTIFVPQRTATDAPTQTTETFVPRNAQEGIDLGLAASQQNAAGIAPITGNLFDYWNNITSGGGQNPYLEPVIQGFTTDFNEQTQRARNQRALQAGAEGAFGGTPFIQGETWADEQAGQNYANTVAGLRYQDFLNTQGLISSAPGQVAATAALGTVPAEQAARYGGMRQQNLADAAAAGDRNAQVVLNNLWQAMSLNDANALASAQESVAQWQAAHQAETARVADVGAQAQTQQQISQAGLDNAFLQWLNQQETLGAKTQNLGTLFGYPGMIPGSTTTGSGTSTTDSTTQVKQQAAPWQVAAGLGGAALQMFAPGGFFSGSLSALGGAKPLAPISPLAPNYTFPGG